MTLRPPGRIRPGRPRASPRRSRRAVRRSGRCRCRGRAAGTVASCRRRCARASRRRAGPRTTSATRRAGRRRRTRARRTRRSPPRPIDRRLGRHRQHGVLAQQSRRGRRCPRAPTRRRSGAAARARVAPAGRDRAGGELVLDRRARPLERAVDRGDGGVQQLGDLGAGPAEHVAQDQHGALAAGQPLDRGQQRELHALALRVAGGRVERPAAAASADSASGYGLDDGLGAPRPALQLVQAGVGGDPVEPGLQRCAALEAAPASARRAAASPARRPRRRAPSRASGSSGPRARGGTARPARGRHARRRPARPRPARAHASCRR